MATFRVERYGTTRFFAVRDAADALVCVCVYRRGAEEVAQRLQALDDTQRWVDANGPAHEVTPPAALRALPPANRCRANERAMDASAVVRLALALPLVRQGGPTFPLEPTLNAKPRSARWQGWPAGGFSAGHLRSPCQQEGAEGLRCSSAAEGGFFRVPAGVAHSALAPGQRRMRQDLSLGFTPSCPACSTRAHYSQLAVPVDIALGPMF